jgi:hypothetical protein
VQKTTGRLFKYARENGLTQAKNPLEFFKDARGKRSVYPAGSTARIVVQALLTSIAASSTLSVKDLTRALAEVRELRSRAASFSRTMSRVDQQLARGNIPAAVPTYSECGNDILASIEVAVSKLENVRGIKVPATAATWRAFVGTTIVALLNAGMVLEDAVDLFALEGDAAKVKHRVQRLRARRTAKGVRARSRLNKS